MAIPQRTPRWCALGIARSRTSSNALEMHNTVAACALGGSEGDSNCRETSLHGIIDGMHIEATIQRSVRCRGKKMVLLIRRDEGVARR